MEIGIIGCGNMGSGFARALGKEHKLFLYDRNDDKTAALAKETKGTAVKTAKEAVQKAELIILAVKPHHIHAVSRDMKSAVNDTKTIVSILTGLSLGKLEDHFKPAAVVRMMPNLALVHGKGVLGIEDDGSMTKTTKTKIEKVFAPLGIIKWLPENLINPLTALTGSGPAFVAVMIESMIDAGISMGFDAETAKMLVIEMIKGSLALLTESKKHPGEIKWEIAAPGGTTIAGLKVLEESGLRSAIINTFLATHNRAKEMSV